MPFFLATNNTDIKANEVKMELAYDFLGHLLRNSRLLSDDEIGVLHEILVQTFSCLSPQQKLGIL